MLAQRHHRRMNKHHGQRDFLSREGGGGGRRVVPDQPHPSLGIKLAARSLRRDERFRSRGTEDLDGGRKRELVVGVG